MRKLDLVILIVGILGVVILWKVLGRDDSVYGAIYRGDARKLEQLLREGRELPPVGPEGRAAITEAIWWWWSSRRPHQGVSEATRRERQKIAHDLVSVLVEHGANPNDRSQFDEVPLLWALTVCTYDTCELLVKAGAQLNILTKQGEPMLYYAVVNDENNGSHQCVKLLLQFGANPNIQGEDGNTVLHLAVEKGIDAKYVLPLIAAGLDIEIANNNGQTALEMAERMNLQEYIELLKTIRSDM